MKFDALSNALSKEVVGAESTEAATASVGVAVGAGALGIAISEAAGVVDAKRMPAPFRRRRLVVEDGKGVFALGNGPLLLERSGLALMERVDENCLGLAMVVLNWIESLHFWQMTDLSVASQFL